LGGLGLRVALVRIGRLEKSKSAVLGESWKWYYRTSIVVEERRMTRYKCWMAGGQRSPRLASVRDRMMEWRSCGLEHYLRMALRNKKGFPAD